jgi:hypothetical protein
MNIMSKIRPNTRKEEVFTMLGLHPNSTTKELADLMPHHTIDNISHAVSSMAAKNLVFVTGKKREEGPSGRITTHSAYSVKYKKVDKDAPPQSTLQADILNELIKALKEEIDVLEKWKQAAIVRYPELSADPVVLQARELVAAEALASGDFQLANATRAGLRDDMIYVRSVIRALKAGE